MIDNLNVISNAIIYESEDYEVSLINRGSKNWSLFLPLLALLLARAS